MFILEIYSNNKKDYIYISYNDLQSFFEDNNILDFDSIDDIHRFISFIEDREINIKNTYLIIIEDKKEIKDILKNKKIVRKYKNNNNYSCEDLILDMELKIEKIEEEAEEYRDELDSWYKSTR